MKFLKVNASCYAVPYVLQALIDASDHEIYVRLACFYNDIYGKGKGTVGTELVGERAALILSEARNLCLFTHLQCLEHIGSYRSHPLKASALNLRLIIGQLI